jgi:hypothetical protein
VMLQDHFGCAPKQYQSRSGICNPLREPAI